jgi:lipoprotein signal peptidase
VILARVAIIVALVVLVDHSIKLLMRRHLGFRTASLGALGHLRVVSAATWLERLGVGRNELVLLCAWIAAAVALVIASFRVPETWLFAGLLLGGSLSHVIERAIRGHVTDYVCLRFWPAFNLADVAMSVGAFGIIAQVMIAESV